MKVPMILGIVGCGEVTEHKHLPALRRVPGIRVAALADRDAATCERVARKYGITTCRTGIESLLSVPGLDTVAICVPPAEHAAAALPAIHAGHRVLIEKPLALSLEDCDRLIEAATAAKAQVTVGFHMRWHRQVRVARALLSDGRIGAVESLRAHWYSPRSDDSLPPWRQRRASGGGALVELGAHLFDLWRHLIGIEVEKVFATARSGSRDDESASVCGFSSAGVGVTGSLSERTAHDIGLEICGDRGMLRLSLLKFDGLELSALADRPGSPVTRLRRLGSFFANLPAGLRTTHRGGEYLESYAAQWAALADGTDSDRGSATLMDGRRSLEICLAALKSAAIGAPVRVGDGSIDVWRSR